MLYVRPITPITLQTHPIPYSWNTCPPSVAFPSNLHYVFNIELFSWHIISFISMVFISPIDVKKKPDWQLGTSLQITCWESSISSRPKTKSFIIISILTGTQYNTWPSGLCNCMITIFWEKTTNFADWLYYDNERDVHVPRFQKQWSIQWRQCETGLDKRTQPNLRPDEVDWHVWVGHVSVNNNNSHWNPHSFPLWIDFKKLGQVVHWWPGRPSGSATCIT